LKKSQKLQIWPQKSQTGNPAWNNIALLATIALTNSIVLALFLYCRGGEPIYYHGPH